MKKIGFKVQLVIFFVEDESGSYEAHSEEVIEQCMLDKDCQRSRQRRLNIAESKEILKSERLERTTAPGHVDGRRHQR